MPFKIIRPGEDNSWTDRRAKRLLLTGPPNSGKTTSLRLWERPMAYVCFPGENGDATLPSEEGITKFVWEDLDYSKAVDWAAVLKEIKTVTADILGGTKYGQFKTYAGDGLHKLYSIFLNVQTGGASAAGEDFEAKLYSGSHKAFFTFIQRVNASLIENVVFTIWDGREKDDPDAKDKDTQKHIFPELPGKAAKDIMGEFSVVLYHMVQGQGAGAKYQWQTKPMGKVWGCGIKAPTEITSKIETFIPQDIKKLMPLLLPAKPVQKEIAK